MFKRVTILIGALAILLTGLTVPAAAHDGPDADISSLLADLRRTDSHFYVGMDTLFLGSIERDEGLGYPRSAWGMSPLLGFTWRTYSGQPSRWEVERAAELTKRFYGDAIGREAFRRRVKREVGVNQFKYFGTSTTAFFLPGIDAGVAWDFADSSGEGLTANVGITWGLNTVFIPFPYVGVAYSF